MIDTRILYGDEVRYANEPIESEWSERNTILCIHGEALKASIVQWEEDETQAGGEGLAFRSTVVLSVIDMRGVRHLLAFDPPTAAGVMIDIGAAMKSIRDDVRDKLRADGKCPDCGGELDSDGNHP